MYPENVVEPISCTTAEQFISKLRLSDKLWLPPNSREAPWLFRGQADAEWPLEPSAWRKAKPGKPETSAEKMKNWVLGQLKDPISQAIQADKDLLKEYEQAKAKNPNIEQVLLQAIFEIEVVRLFAEFVDRLGFPVPQATLLRSDMSTAYDWKARISGTLNNLKSLHWQCPSNYQIWPFKDDPVVALARHHSVPTCLVDWTRKPLIAAYFAANEVMKLDKRPDFIAVWSIHRSIIIDEGARLRHPRLFRSELGYLHVQDAVLTYDAGADYHFIQHGIWPDIVQAVQATPHSLEHAPLRKITMPATEIEVKELLRLLWAEGISRAHLMPTFDNISSMLQDEWMRF